MSWLKHVEKLREEGKVAFRPKGNSMVPRINSGDLVTVSLSKEYNIGDVVLCKVGRNHYVHLVKAIVGKGDKRRPTHGYS